jgi:ABC-type antimicrobial peptide transport system permease subunit
MALGARRSSVFGLVTTEGLRLVLAGTALGSLAALGLGQWLRSLLFGVTATDVATFGAVSLLQVGVAILACFLPARRAARVEPLTALRDGH